MTTELDYLNEENGRLRREIATWKAETKALIKRAEDAEAAIDSLTLVNRGMHNKITEQRAEVERLKAELANQTTLANAWKHKHDLASGAAHTSKTIDVKWHHDLAKKETDQ